MIAQANPHRELGRFLTGARSRLLRRITAARPVRGTRTRQSGHSGARARAVFTVVQNEPAFLPLWLRYYGGQFEASDIYVLDHESTDRSTEGIGDRCQLVPIHREDSFDHRWLRSTVERFQSFLLCSYGSVLFTEVDEFVVADPTRYESLGSYIEGMEGSAACCTGYNVVQYPDEAQLRFDRPVLSQRRNWHPSRRYSKRLLGRVPLSWGVGFHKEYNASDAHPDPELYLIHLHRVDYGLCLDRHRSAASRNWNEADRQHRLGWQSRVVDSDEFRDWFFHGPDLDGSPEPIPDHVKAVL
jgi:hypothetical protein